MINIQSVYKSFNGNSVLEDISLKIDFGQIYCLLGKNGAGKTTIFNLILNLLKPDKGHIEIFNKANNKLNNNDKKRIGVLREDLSIINELTGMDYLFLTGYLYHIPKSEIEQKINELGLFFFGKDIGELNKRINKYSFGTKKKTELLSALLSSPDILILDEPFSGLDPLFSRQLISFLSDYSNKNRIILLSSHNLNYIEKISTHIGILHNKKIILNSPIEKFPVGEKEKFEDAFCRITECDENNKIPM